MTPYDETLAAGLSNGLIQIFSLDDGVLVGEYFAANTAVITIAFGPDRLIVYQTDEGKGLKLPYTISIWNTLNNKIVFSRNGIVEGGKYGFNPLVISPDGKWFSFRENNGYNIMSSEDGRPTWKVNNGTPRTFSPDGGMLLAINEDGKSFFYSAEAGKLLYTLPFFVAQFTPNSRQVLTIEGNSNQYGDIKLFDLPTENSQAKLIQRFDGFPIPSTICCIDNMSFQHIAVSPDGKYLALMNLYFQDYSEMNSIKIYLMIDGSLVNEIPMITGPNGYIEERALSDKEKWFAYPRIQEIFFVDSVNDLLTFESSGISGAILKLRRWDVGSGKELLSSDLPQEELNFTALNFNSDGSQLVVSKRNGVGNSIHFIDLDKGVFVREIPDPESWYHGILRGLEFVQKGKTLLIHGGSQSSSIDISTGQSIYPKNWDCEPETQDVYSYPKTFSPDGNLMVCDFGKYATIVDVLSGKITAKFLNPAKGSFLFVGDAHFSPDGKLLAISFEDYGKTLIIDVANLEIIQDLKSADSITFSPDGRFLILSVDNWGYYFYDIKNGELIKTIYNFDQLIQGVTFSPDGTLMVTGSSGGMIFWGIQR
ncbi:MAG: hypothetical protein CVU39_01740 [Chloroflexi bacterium HGW-Chloroflexi-10]|nr:MAG: hypothetical protein CVU39_01740 [Chloroflexi bacterium HGW-Chloroflexi-10]